MKLYRVIKDRQGGHFAMGWAGSAAEWLDTMVDWRDSDDSWGDWGNGHKGYEDERKKAIKWWKDQLAAGKEQDLIDYISEMWDLDFQAISEDLQAHYQKYCDEFDRAEGEPVCLCEWLDCEAVELGLIKQDNPGLPNEIDLTDCEMPTPDQLVEAIEDYLIQHYGKMPSSYGIEIKLTEIDWEEY